MENLRGGLSPSIRGMGGSLSPAGGISGAVAVPQYAPRPSYSDLYEVTPGESDVVLETRGRDLKQNIVVKAVPKEYGRIVWNGAFLRIV